MADYKHIAVDQIQYLVNAVFSKWKTWGLIERTVILSSSGWSSSAPYIQTVSVENIKASDNPLVLINTNDSSYTSGSESDQALIEAQFGYIKSIVTADGSITATCTFRKPTVDIPIILRGH